MGDVNLEVLRRSGDTRRLHIRMLRNLADELDLLLQVFNKEKIKGNGASLTGGSLGIISSIATIATGGLALPVLGALGSITGVCGLIWNFMGTKKKAEKEKEILNKIMEIVKEDKVLQEEVRSEMSKYEILNDTKRYAVGEQILVILKGWGCVYQSLGPQAAFMALTGALGPIAMLFTEIPVVMAFLGNAGIGVKEYFAKGAMEVGDEVIRNAVENAGKTLPKDWTRAVIMENAYGEIVKRHGNFWVKLSAEGADALAEEVTKEIASQAKYVSQWVGGMTAGLGAIFCIWDIYQISEAWDASKEGYKTKLGIVLRRIAGEIETSMSRPRG